jgi:hypothetical protein
MSTTDHADWRDYAALFLVALGTLVLEILLTRIFSVTLWYHLAFIAVSVAMFGMTFGAVIVYVASGWFHGPRLRPALAITTALFGLTAVWSVQTQLGIGVDVANLRSPLRELALAYGVAAVPFTFSGIAVSLALTRFPWHVSRLYAADLAGAATGCIVLVVLLEAFEGPPVVFVVAGSTAIAAMLFAQRSPLMSSRQRTLVTLGVLLLVFGWTCDRARGAGLQVRQAKGSSLSRPLYEKWNSYSRIAVGPPREEWPFGWGLSHRYGRRNQVRQLHLDIDASAETVLTVFNGELGDLDHLRYDVTNVAHYLAKDTNVFVIGAGGGRDVLSALVFGQRHVTAVEMNKAIIEAVNDEFGAVTGHLDRNPQIRFVNDEARSFLARSDARFGLIQISLIDTWAATAAGAFVLSENTLYTREAWELFWRKLDDEGILSVSRWYNRPRPLEVYKLAALAVSALRASGVTEPRQHLLLLATKPNEQNPGCCGNVATLMVRRAPFSQADLAQIDAVAREMDFEVVLSPTMATDDTFARLADPRQTDAVVAEFDVELVPPTDDRPFFFKMDSTLLTGLFQLVTVLSIAFIALPVAIKADRRAIVRHLPSSVVFAAIGLAFMLVEISLMQRLTLLLGHPTFSLSVVLAGLLVAGGLGSFSTARLTVPPMPAAVARRLGALLLALMAIGWLAPPLIDLSYTASTPVRVAVALALIVPAGIFMGMPFPMAMMISSIRRPTLTAWLWGINGAASICAAVLAVIISSNLGISIAWWSGVACYAVAAFFMVRDARGAAQAADSVVTDRHEIRGNREVEYLQKS